MIIKDIQKYIKLYDTEKYLFDVIGTTAQKRGFLTFNDFYMICMWKSARQKPNYLKNKDTVEKITKIAFAEKDEAIKINMLCNLMGVGIKTASAILTVVFPKKYGVMDERCLDMLKIYDFNISKYSSVKTWLNYLYIIRKVAKENKISPRELDMALFAMHKQKLEKKNYRNLYK